MALRYPAETAVDAGEFWFRLEYRICGELAGVPDNSVRFWWCDGFMADKHRSGDAIRGGVWMCDGPRQYKWRFTLCLPEAFDPDTDDWSTLLPADDVTGWLRMDKSGQEITIDPARVRPDRSPVAG